MSSRHSPQPKRQASIACIALVVMTGIIFLFGHPEAPSNICSSFDRDYLVGVGKYGGTRTDRLKAYKAQFPALRPLTDRGRPTAPSPSGSKDHQITPFDWPTIKTLFAFGDSFTTNYQYRMYQEWQDRGDGTFDPAVHLNNRKTDRIWTDWLWSTFTDTSKTKYYNLARPGATISREVLPPGQEEWGTLEDQLADFEQIFSRGSGQSNNNNNDDWQSNSTLFLMFFGINDISQLDRRTAFDSPIQQTCGQFAHALFEQSSKLYDMGARHFVFLNAHPFYRSPKYTLEGGVGHDVYGRVVDSVTWFNEAYGDEIELFRQRHPQANVISFDLFRYIDLIMDEPELFGMTETERFHMTIDDTGDETNHGRLGFV
ncbi:hypothetical protein BD324DRAFT_617506 [Kockovaella imperatae]|uniref:Uncharacterized protein n=1 Tax=Kockovaella imperatae TaxID=4999 RepID=A0A1Y1ULB4_9TREE|nr:hypothetical protein BD324DRAFT_617506 [Kockovaella imperatae]ORX38838.1 hypothetical protein BD324DRAFT_617506 [Kockovaella imperatae]